MARAATSAALALSLLHGCSAISLSLRGAEAPAPEEEEAEMPAAAKLELSLSAARPSPDLRRETCGDAERGDQCWKAVKWSHFSGIKKHPEWYPNLSAESSFKEIQTDLARRGKASCKMPCPQKPPEPMPVAEMNVDQLNRFLNNEWDGVVTTTVDPKKWLAEWEYDRPASTTQAPAKEEMESTIAPAAEEQNATDAAEQNATDAAPAEKENATTEGASQEASANASDTTEGEADTKEIAAEVQELEDKVMKAKKALDDAATEADEKKDAGSDREARLPQKMETAYGDNLDNKEASLDEWATDSNATEATAARQSEDASDAVNSSEAEREAIEADRLQERQEQVLDSYPAYPGCFVRLPTGCTNHHRKSHLWRHDVWAEQGKNLTDSDCKLRRRYWNEFCGIDDAKVLHIAPPEGERQRLEDYASEEKKSWVVDGYPHHAGCYMRMPSGCKKHFKKSHLWRHDVWAEERNVNASQCGDRRGFWNDFCGVSDAKVVFKELPVHASWNSEAVEDPENATAMRESGAALVDEERLPMVDDNGAIVNSSADSVEPSHEASEQLIATERLDSNATADQEANATVEENATAEEAPKENALEASNETAAAEEAPVEEAKVEETTTTVQIVNAEALPEVDMEALNMTEEAEAAARKRQETEAELKEQLLQEMRKQMGITESTTTAPAILETVHQQSKAEVEAQMRAELLEKLRKEEADATTTADPKAELEAEVRKEMLAKIRAEETTTTAPAMSRAEIEAQIRSDILKQLHYTTTTPVEIHEETREEMTIRIKAEMMQKMREEEAAKAEKAVLEELRKAQATTTQAAETAAEMGARLKAKLRAEMQQALASASLDDLVASTTAPHAESAAEMEARIKADLMASLHKEEATTTAAHEETREEMVARIKAKLQSEISS